MNYTMKTDYYKDEIGFKRWSKINEDGLIVHFRNDKELDQMYEYKEAIILDVNPRE